MTVFKTFLKILRKNLFMVIVFSGVLILFAGLNMNSQDKSATFTSVKPDVIIVNQDEEKGITKGFIDYIKENSVTPSVKDDEEARNDALFYNDTDYIIYIPKGFNEDFMEGKIDSLEVKKGMNFNSSYAEMMINRYLHIASTYRDKVDNQDDLVKIINEVLKNNTEVEITSKLDTDNLARAVFYYNFESYSLIVSLLFIITLILSIFNSDTIRKRTVISSTNYKKNNRILLLCNLLYAFVLWAIYTVLSFFLIGDVMFTANGIMLIINSFIHLIMLTSLAFFIGNAIKNKDVVNGVTNVVGLGTSFLCGVFVPLSYLPDSVVKIAHIIPTYYYVESNEMITTLEEVNMTTLQPIIANMGILIGSTIIFIILSNVITNRRRKLG